MMSRVPVLTKDELKKYLKKTVGEINEDREPGALLTMGDFIDEFIILLQKDPLFLKIIKTNVIKTSELKNKRNKG